MNYFVILVFTSIEADIVAGGHAFRDGGAPKLSRMCHQART
jgi:hypothetical protein